MQFFLAVMAEYKFKKHDRKNSKRLDHNLLN